MFTSRFQEWVRVGARRVVVALHLQRLTPNVLTLMGLVVTAISSVFIGGGWLAAGGVVLAAAALFDIADGAVARVSGKVFRYGAFLDSTADRYAEGLTYLALLAYFLFHDATPHRVESMLVILALAGSFLVSYVRARALSLGFTCEGGVLARPERVVLTVVGLILSPLLVPVLWILATLTNLTALQRIFLVWRESRATAPPETPVPDVSHLSDVRAARSTVGERPRTAESPG